MEGFEICRNMLLYICIPNDANKPSMWSSGQICHVEQWPDVPCGVVVRCANSAVMSRSFESLFLQPRILPRYNQLTGGQGRQETLASFLPRYLADRWPEVARDTGPLLSIE